MPSVSLKQRRFFGAIEGGSIPRPAGMSDKTVRDFASTKEAGLPDHAPARHMADGGKADGHWMERAFANAGKKGHSLHASLHVPADKKIPAERLAAAKHSPDAHVARMAQAATNANPRKRKHFGA